MQDYSKLDQLASNWHQLAHYREKFDESEYFEKALAQSELLLEEITKITHQEPFRLEFMASCFANNFGVLTGIIAHLKRQKCQVGLDVV